MNILKILLKDYFTDREFGLLYDCMKYTSTRPDSVAGPAGLPGHNLILVIVKLFKILMRISSSLTEDRARMIIGKGIESERHNMNYIDKCFVLLFSEEEDE